MQHSLGDPHATDLQTQEVKSVRVWRMKIRSGSIAVKYSGYYTCVLLQYILNDTGGYRMEEMRQKNQEDLCLLALSFSVLEHFYTYTHRASLVWMISILVVRVSDCQCRSRNSPGFASILRHSGIRGAADEAVLHTVLGKKEIQKNPPV
jgi:hypothetical protein